MRNVPRISVLMAVRNGLPFLESTLDSLRRQTFRDFELVIVEDASTDDTRDLLISSKKTDHRLKVLHNERPLKLPASLNRGLFCCRAEVIARADADDVFHAGWLELQYKALHEMPRIGVLGAACKLIDSEGRNLGESHHPVEDAVIRFDLPFISRIHHPGTLVRKSLLIEAGGYDELFWTAQDYELWSRLINRTAFRNSKEPLFD